MVDAWAQFPDAPKVAAPATTPAGSDPWAQFPDAKQTSPSVLARVNAGASGFNAGVASLLGIPVDTAANVLDLGKSAIEGGYLLAGKLPPTSLDPSRDRSNVVGSGDWFRKLMGSAAENPNPNDTASRYLHAAGSGAAQGMAFGGAAGIPGAVRGTLSGISGSVSAQGAKDLGAGAAGQAVAGLVGGMVPGTVEATARGAYQVARNAVRPMTKAGQEDMAAQIIQQQATNRLRAAQNLDVANEIVPGSPRTMGEASQDPGLLALEKGIRGRDTAAFGERTSQQNAAQQAELRRVAGTPADIEAMRQARDTQTTPMRDAALSNPVGSTIGAPVQAVTDKIDAILASPVGERQVVNKALSDFRAQLEGKTDPARLYEIRKDINDAMDGKLGGDKAVYALARGQLSQVKDVLDNAIEFAAPGFKAYLDRYKSLSKPINQAEVMQEIANRAQSTSLDVRTGENFLAPAQFSRALDQAIAEGNLSPQQVQQLNAIRTDIQYGQAINSRLVKAPGSDTFQNLSIAQVLGAGPISQVPALRVLSKPLDWIYKAAGADPKVNELLRDAALDPKVAAAMLRRATPKSVFDFSQALRRTGAGAVTGAVVAQDSVPQAQISERRRKR